MITILLAMLLWSLVSIVLLIRLSNWRQRMRWLDPQDQRSGYANSINASERRQTWVDLGGLRPCTIDHDHSASCGRLA